MKKFEGFQKGVNLGGWISQFAKYDEEHFKTFITEEDIKYISSLGFDHVRVPVDYNVLEDEEGNSKETGFKYLEDARCWCEKYGLKMVLDLHECFGYSFDPLKKDMDRKKFFYDDALQNRFMNLWKKIAERFSKYQNMIAFEPLNEVVLMEVKDAWNEIASKWIKMMREIVPNAYLIIGGVCYNAVSSVELLNVPVDDRVVFNFHCYEPHIFTHQGNYWEGVMPLDFRTSYPKTIEEYRKESVVLYNEFKGGLSLDNVEMGVDFFEAIFAPAIAAAEEAGVALYCGEYGVIDLADNESKINWLRDIHTAFNNHGIGRALWNYKEKDFGFVDPSFSEVKEEFIDIL